MPPVMIVAKYGPGAGEKQALAPPVPLAAAAPVVVAFLVRGAVRQLWRQFVHRPGQLENEAAGDGVGGLHADKQGLADLEYLLAALAPEAGVALVVGEEIALQVA